MQQPEKVKRIYHCKDSELLLATSTICASAAEHQEALQDADATLTGAYLTGLSARTDTAIREVLGADNAAALRKASRTLFDMHDAALEDAGMVKTLIETKYSTDAVRRTELLNTLGFHSFYTQAAHGNQDAMGSMLSRFAKNLTPDLEAELTGKGLQPARTARLRAAATAYNPANTAQEGAKQGRTELTDADLQTLNGLYSEVSGICKMGQRVFKQQPVVHDAFSFSHVVAAQSSFAANNHPQPLPVPPAPPVQ